MTDAAAAPTILLLEHVHPSADEVLTTHGLHVRRHDGSLAGRDLADALEGVDLLGIRSKSQVDAEVLGKASHLIAIGCFCIGTNQVNVHEACRHGIAVFNSPFSNTRSVAEMTIAEIIALHRRLFDKSRAMHEGRWDKSAAHAHEVRGRTLGIVGYGHIGSQVSVLAESLGMRVIYYDIAPKLPMGNALAMPSLDALLEAADIVTLHVPATPATEGMIGRAELSRMRESACLLNNARGSIVDLDALAESLRGGRLIGAALDVYPAEPSASSAEFECPLRGVPNVLLTPHIGGSTEEAQQNIALDVAQKLVRYVRDGTTTSAVNVPEVDLPHRRPGQHRILHFHRNVPGVLSKMHAIMAELSVNITAEYLQSDADISYVILDVEPQQGEAMKQHLREIPETIRVRTLW